MVDGKRVMSLLLGAWAAIFATAQDGVTPQRMAAVASARLAQLDRIVADVTVDVHLAPLTGDPLDQGQWSEPFDPGDGRNRHLTIARPNALDETEQALSSFYDGGVTRRYPGTDRDGHLMYSEIVSPYKAGVYTSTAVLQLFDLDVHESWVRGLNAARLLTDYPAELVRAADGVSTYAVALQWDEDYLWGPSSEDYEFDLADDGTPLRFKFTKRLLGSEHKGFTFTREMFTTATAPVGDVRIVTEAVAVTSNSIVAQKHETRGIDHFEVTSFRFDPTLTPEDVALPIERRNARVWRSTDLDEETTVYDSAGNIVDYVSASTGLQQDRSTALVTGSAVVACACVAACAPFVSHQRRKRRVVEDR
jgi:hypothetical protein